MRDGEKSKRNQSKESRTILLQKIKQDCTSTVHCHVSLIFLFGFHILSHFITEMKCAVRIGFRQIYCPSGYIFRLWLLVDSATTAQKYSLCFWSSFAIPAYCEQEFKQRAVSG